jgi:hypothetical protein
MTDGEILIVVLVLAVIAIQTINGGRALATRDEILAELQTVKDSQATMTTTLANIKADVERLANTIPPTGGLTEVEALALREELKLVAGTAQAQTAEAQAIDTLGGDPPPA